MKSPAALSLAAPGGFRRAPSRGFTIMETMLALGILATVLVLVAQLGLWSWRERTRNGVRHQALECAANVLEAARACPWEALTPEWGNAQQLPESLAQRLAQGKLTVRVEPDAARPHIKRVTVQIQGVLDLGPGVSEVQLVGWFSARSAVAAGGKP
jgi:type II secretory pathway pseudopilin PulG